MSGVRRRNIDLENLWPRRSEEGLVLVPYNITPADTYIMADLEAEIRVLESKLKVIKFVQRTTEEDYISLISDDGCYSQIGRIGGENALSLGAYCNVTHIIQHEFLHALGMYHEQVGNIAINMHLCFRS